MGRDWKDFCWVKKDGELNFIKFSQKELYKNEYFQLKQFTTVFNAKQQNINQL